MERLGEQLLIEHHPDADLSVPSVERGHCRELGVHFARDQLVGNRHWRELLRLQLFGCIWSLERLELDLLVQCYADPFGQLPPQ